MLHTQTVVAALIRRQLFRFGFGNEPVVEWGWLLVRKSLDIRPFFGLMLCSWMVSPSDQMSVNIVAAVAGDRMLRVLERKSLIPGKGFGV